MDPDYSLETWPNSIYCTKEVDAKNNDEVRNVLTKQTLPELCAMAVALAQINTPEIESLKTAVNDTINNHTNDPTNDPHKFNLDDLVDIHRYFHREISSVRGSRKRARSIRHTPTATYACRSKHAW